MLKLQRFNIPRLLESQSLRCELYCFVSTLSNLKRVRRT